MRRLGRRKRSLLGALALATVPTMSAAQQATVSGIVAERPDGTPVIGAEVRLSGLPAQTTGRDGRFVFSAVPPARYTLIVDVLGYRPFSTELIVRADTALEIGLEPDPVRLDSLRVEAATITVRGTVRDARTGGRLMEGAQVTRYPGSLTRSATSGMFTIDNVPRGEPVGLLVESFEYLPRRIELVAENDTTLDITLEVDSVVLKMIAQQVERLETRARGIPHAVEALNRDYLERAPITSIGELLHRMLPPGMVPSGPPFPYRLPYRDGKPMCVMLDDLPSSPAEAFSAPPGMIERLEIIGRGRMIRVYTKRYVARLMRVDRLGTVNYMDNGMGVVCS